MEKSPCYESFASENSRALLVKIAWHSSHHRRKALCSLVHVQVRHGGSAGMQAQCGVALALRYLYLCYASHSNPAPASMPSTRSNVVIITPRRPRREY